MLATVGLLALAVLGAEGPPQAQPLTYQLHVYEMKGLGWRAAVHERLQPVARQGGATIWTARRTTARELGSLAESVVQAPQLTVLAGASAHLALGTPAPHETGVRQASFTPEEKPIRAKCSATFTGRKLDQGVLTKFVLEETRVLAVHQVAYSATKDAPAHPSLQVPEVVGSDVIGEWLIPNDGALVISLGAHTVAAADGKAEVRERLVVLEAGPFAPAERLNKTSVFPSAPRPMLIAPSRALPQPFRPDGTLIELPQLPADVTPTSLPGSSEPCASPQARIAPAPDPALQRTSFNFKLHVSPSTMPMLFMAVKMYQGMLDLWPVLDEFKGLTLPSGKYMRDDVKYFPPPPTLPSRDAPAVVKAEDFVPFPPLPPPPEAKPSAAIPLPQLPGKKSEE